MTALPPDDRRHGTLTGYRMGCRCTRCKQSRADWSAGYRANGPSRPRRQIPAAPAQAHVRQLVAAGGTKTRIATAAGCSNAMIHMLLNGTNDTIGAGLADRLLALTIDQVARRSNAGRPPSTAVTGMGTPPPGGWYRDGACGSHPTDLWFPVSGPVGRRGGADATYTATVRQAKAICAACPVLDECRAHGLAHEEHGIWGGLTEKDRRDIRRGQRGAA